MSVVGLTFGSGANAIRPSAASAASVATSASTREVGCVRSYHAKPAAEREAEDEQRGGDPAHCTTSGRRSGGRARSSAAPSSGEQRAAAEDAGGLGGEVPAAAEHLGGRRVGHRRAVAEQHGPLRPHARRTRRRGSRRAPRCPRPPARAGARRARPCGRGPCRGSARRGRRRREARPAATIASASRWRSPPDRSRGWRSASAASPAASSASAGSSSPTRSATR